MKKVIVFLFLLMIFDNLVFSQILRDKEDYHKSLEKIFNAGYEYNSIEAQILFHPEAVPFLIEKLKSENHFILKEAIILLSLNKDTSSTLIENIGKFVDHSNYHIASIAIDGLGQRGDKRAVVYMCNLLGKEKVNNVSQILIALKNITHVDALPCIEEFIKMNSSSQKHINFAKEIISIIKKYNKNEEDKLALIQKEIEEGLFTWATLKIAQEKNPYWGSFLSSHSSKLLIEGKKAKGIRLIILKYNIGLELSKEEKRLLKSVVKYAKIFD